MDINLEEFFKAEEYLDEVNKQSIDSTRFFYKGKQLSISKKSVEQWKKVGYCISTVIIGDFKEEYKEWKNSRK